MHAASLTRMRPGSIVTMAPCPRSPPDGTSHNQLVADQSAASKRSAWARLALAAAATSTSNSFCVYALPMAKAYNGVAASKSGLTPGFF